MAENSEKKALQLQLAEIGRFEINKVPVPILAADQVLIRQKVTTINAVDCKQRDYGILISRWPHVLGIEGAGIVEAVGPDVKAFQPGDEVAGWMAGQSLGGWGGSYQEMVAVPEKFLMKRPKNITLGEAASLPIGFVTALIAIISGLNTPLPFMPGTLAEGYTPSSVLILGGSCATGAAAMQMLRLAYPELPILATASSVHHEYLKSRGATLLFDYHSATLVSDIKAASPNGSGVDVIIDCTSAGAKQTDICDTLNPAGAKKYSSVFTGAEVTVPDGVAFYVVNGFSWIDMPGSTHVLNSITQLVEQGKYKVPLPVKIVGHGLEDLPKVMDQVWKVSCEKLTVTL